MTNFIIKTFMIRQIFLSTFYLISQTIMTVSHVADKYFLLNGKLF